MMERFETFTLLISQISRSIRKIKTEEMAEFKLKSPHVSCLYYLYKEKTLTAKELCDICDEDKAAILRSLLYLEKEGYIACTCESTKRYKTPLKLTSKGELVGERITKKVDKILFKAGNGLSEEERDVFYKNLRKINENLQEICNNYII